MKIRSVIVLLVWLFTWVLVPVEARWTALWPSLVALVSVFLLDLPLGSRISSR